MVEEKLLAYGKLVEENLNRFFPLEELPQKRVAEACRYSLLGGGKRLRPALFLEFFRQCGGGSPEKALPFACGLEMIHTYSLIHDDLPCMDDDDYRRGRLSNHKAFDEATAVLAGDALLNRAFEVMSQCSTADPAAAMKTIALISRCSGYLGMIGGQILDLAYEDRSMPEKEMKNMIALKTGCLLHAACVGGCVLAGADEALQNAAGQYAAKLGMAFQIQDDLLDVLGDSAKLGKKTGSDAEQNKDTFVTLYGVEGCRRQVAQLTDDAVQAAERFPDGAFLQELARWLAQRDH